MYFKYVFLNVFFKYVFLNVFFKYVFFRYVFSLNLNMVTLLKVKEWSGVDKEWFFHFFKNPASLIPMNMDSRQ